MFKTTIREIRQSLGRFIAIFLIVALGVGFFAGLRVTDLAMVKTADGYFSRLHFYDYRLISTLGFDEGTAEKMRQEEDVEAAEGVKSSDMIVVTPDEKEEEWILYEMPVDINRIELVSGSLPVHKDEIVVDSKSYGEDMIGQTIRVSENNDEDHKDLLKVKEFKITGLAKSPLYIHYGRGTTSLGDGQINAFAYVLEDVFDMDYDTSIFIRLKGCQDHALYSDEYKDYIDEKNAVWEKLVDDYAIERYERIHAEVEEELADAKADFKKEIRKARRELKDARKELDDGWKELLDGEKELADGKKELADNEKLLADKEKEWKQGQKDYEKGKKEYEDGLKQYKAGKKEYDAGVRAFKAGEETFAKEAAPYYENKKQYEEGLSSYQKSLNEYKEAAAAYEAGKDYMPEEESAAMAKQLAGWKAGLDASKSQLDGAKVQLDAASHKIEAGEKELAAQRAKIEAGGKEMAASKKQLDAAAAKLQTAKKQLDSGKKQIEDGKKQIEDGKKEIEKHEKELVDGRKELEDGEKEYKDGRKEFKEKKADAEIELEDAEEEVASLEAPNTYLLDRMKNEGCANFENDSTIVKSVARVFPVFFFLIAGLVCMTTMTRMVEEQRMQIGTFKALGYSDAAILFKYLFYSGSAALSGGIVGYFLGIKVFPWVIWTCYGMMYNVADIQYVMEPASLILCLIVAAICSMGATYVSVHQELRDHAATLMRPKAPKTGQRVFLEQIPAIWNRLKFLDKVSVRNLFRYKKRFFMMIIGISGCCGLIVTGFGIKDSIAPIADKQFGEIFTYEMVAGLKEDNKGEEKLLEEIRQVPGIDTLSYVRGESVDAVFDDATKSVNLIVPKDMDDMDLYYNLHEVKGDKLPMPGKGQVLISKKLAEKQNIKVGDRINLRNDDLQGGEVVVSGIFENYFMHYAILSGETYKEIFRKHVRYNELILKTKEDADVHKVGADLLKEDTITAISVNVDTMDTISNMMSAMNYVVILVIVSAGLLAFVVIYNLNNINITERIREIATIKVLGFYKNETKSYIFRENLVLTLIGGLLGLFLGTALHAFVLSQINLDAISFAREIKPISYVFGIILTLCFNWLVNVFMAGKLEAIDMAESLKSVE